MVVSDRTAKLQMCGRMISLVAIALFLSSAVQAQTSSPEPVENKRPAPFELKLSTTTTMLCIGNSIELELELTNVSQEPVEIDKLRLWDSFFYSHSRPDGSGRNGGSSTNCGHCGKEKITLAPGANYRDKHTFSLDYDFFQEAGTYTIEVDYDQISSNSVEFELYECNQK